MQFNISGHVRETESGLGVRGVIVRAGDWDNLYSKLPAAVTDDQGRFEIVLDDREIPELFENQPDIYLSLLAPPCRLLMDGMSEPVPWAAGKCKPLEFQIDRRKLGSLSPAEPDGEVAGGVPQFRERIQVNSRDGFDILQLPGFGTGVVPGAPALPERTVYVALPLGNDEPSLDYNAGDSVRREGPFNPLPVQEPTPDVGIDPKQFDDGFSVDNVAVRFTPPDPRYYEGKVRFPPELVELEGVEQIGAIRMAAVRVRPVQFDPVDQSLLFYPNLRFSVRFDLEQARRHARQRDYSRQAVSAHYSGMIDALLGQQSVEAARDLFFPGLTFDDHVSQVIITDNFAWPESVDRPDGTPRAPDVSERGLALTGDLVAEFERLAEWKTARGVRSRVVTITEIVSGAFGDFTEGGFARDLPEVLRNFIKFAQTEWQVDYVLLGGDVNIVPMRRLVGSDTFDTIGCARVATNPPPATKCHFVAGKAAVKIRPGFTPGDLDPLSTMHGGVRIPFDRTADSSRLGWYYTSRFDFLHKDEGFTRLPTGISRFIIVEGPESIIDDDYYWVRPVNKIPSDLYYASLVGPNYSRSGKHDFDTNNNELYGQFHTPPGTSLEASLDGVDVWSDVWVGRVAATSGDQARAFVDKVLTYERLETPDGSTSVDASYLEQVLYASDHWGIEVWRQSDTSLPPQESTFTHVAGSNVTKVHTSFDLTLSGGATSHRLVADPPGPGKLIPYDTSASPTMLGWHFVTDNTYNVPSPTPSRFVKVVGPEADIDPDSFFWHSVGLESAAEEKETLRRRMNNWFPTFSSVERHYTEQFGLAPPPSIVALEESTVRAALDDGRHFVSLSGHGSNEQCCRIDLVSSKDFANLHKYFVAFADACGTAAPDGTDSLAEVATNDPDGGAVAYVGNTRYSWIGSGDNYERFFWHKLSIFGRLGPAAGLRLATGGVRRIWTVYAQNLFGDPEMPVWTDVPGEHVVTHPETATWGSVITVTVSSECVPAAGRRVTLLGGWTNSAESPHVWMTKTTNVFGNASFELPATGNGVSEVQVTVTHRNLKPYVGRVVIESSQ